MFVPLILMGVCALFGFSWIVFTFVNPPWMLSQFYQAPSFLYFLGDTTAKLLIGILIGVVAPLAISMFMY
jgi:hypothetical protein